MSLNVAKHVWSGQKWDTKYSRAIHWCSREHYTYFWTSSRANRRQKEKERSMSGKNSSLCGANLFKNRASGLLRIHFPKFPMKRRRGLLSRGAISASVPIRYGATRRTSSFNLS